MSKPPIYAVMTYYNEEHWIAQSLYALRHFIDGIILVDGAYEGYNPDTKAFHTHYSYDETNNLIRQFMIITRFKQLDFLWFSHRENNIWFYSKEEQLHDRVYQKGWKNEMEKRTFAINQVPEEAFFFIVDADELVLGSPTLFRKELYAPLEEEELVRSVGVVHYPSNVDWFLMPRIYKKKEGMEYDASHANIFYNNQQITWPSTENKYNKSRAFSSLSIIHMSEFYPQEAQQILKWNYISRRQQEENVDRWKRKKTTGDIVDAIEEMMKEKRATGVFYREHSQEEE